MSRKQILLLLVLVLAVSLEACATSKPMVQYVQLPPEIKIVNRYPDKPGVDLLTCKEEPVVPIELTREGATDTQAAEYTQNVLDAGDDCRKKLKSIRAWVDAWPTQ